MSGSSAHFEDCWKGANFLKDCLVELGVHTQLVSRISETSEVEIEALPCHATAQVACGEQTSPLVLGRLGTNPAKSTIVVYGHYDVQPATAVGALSLLRCLPNPLKYNITVLVGVDVRIAVAIGTM